MTNMEQISIWDILEEKKSDMELREPCGRYCEVAWCSLNCYFKRGYIRDPSTQKWARDENGNILISNNKECDWTPDDELPCEEEKSQGWQYLLHTDYIEWTSEETMQLVRTVNENHIMDNPDVICEGTVNGIPAYIGFKQWESGPNGIYIEYEAIQWKEKTT